MHTYIHVYDVLYKIHIHIHGILYKYTYIYITVTPNLNPKSYSLSPKPKRGNPKPYYLNPKSELYGLKPTKSLNPYLYRHYRNPKPETLNLALFLSPCY